MLHRLCQPCQPLASIEQNKNQQPTVQDGILCLDLEHAALPRAVQSLLLVCLLSLTLPQAYWLHRYPSSWLSPSRFLLPWQLTRNESLLKFHCTSHSHSVCISDSSIGVLGAWTLAVQALAGILCGAKSIHDAMILMQRFHDDCSGVTDFRPNHRSSKFYPRFWDCATIVWHAQTCKWKLFSNPFFVNFFMELSKFATFAQETYTPKPRDRASRSFLPTIFYCRDYCCAQRILCSSIFLPSLLHLAGQDG